ncbi:MAG: sugar kinase [Anaerolineae bacterium]|nr:sugar kinase [Anaerolineae bacterium]
MPTVVTFGEAMIRLSPPDFRRIEQATSFDLTAGGAELNVAVGLARLGVDSAWVSRLPDNALGRLCRNRARELGVDTSHILWSKDDRMGLYFVEFGAAPRASSVLYDRAGSAISRISPSEVDWASVLDGARWFHTSGITPALSDGAAQVAQEAIMAAKQASCTVSYDLNYRARLWSQEKARQVQSPLMQNVDVLFTTEEDTERVFGIKAENYQKVAELLSEQFGFQAVVITLREDISVWRNRWSAFVYQEGQHYLGPTYELEIVDRVGGGDSCSAGFIYKSLSGAGPQEAINFAVAFSALKHSIPGDFNLASEEEANRLLAGGGLRISR